jgi:hypothetical protein
MNVAVRIEQKLTAMFRRLSQPERNFLSEEVRRSNGGSLLVRRALVEASIKGSIKRPKPIGPDARDISAASWYFRKLPMWVLRDLDGTVKTNALRRMIKEARGQFAKISVEDRESLLRGCNPNVLVPAIEYLVRRHTSEP